MLIKLLVMYSCELIISIKEHNWNMLAGLSYKLNGVASSHYRGVRV